MHSTQTNPKWLILPIAPELASELASERRLILPDFKTRTTQPLAPDRIFTQPDPTDPTQLETEET